MKMNKLAFLVLSLIALQANAASSFKCTQGYNMIDFSHVPGDEANKEKYKITIQMPYIDFFTLLSIKRPISKASEVEGFFTYDKNNAQDVADAGLVTFLIPTSLCKITKRTADNDASFKRMASVNQVPENYFAFSCSSPDRTVKTPGKKPELNSVEMHFARLSQVNDPANIKKFNGEVSIANVIAATQGARGYVLPFSHGLKYRISKSIKDFETKGTEELYNIWTNLPYDEQGTGNGPEGCLFNP